MYKLVIQDDEGKTTVVPLIRDEITIGRKEGNTIRLTERNVSRKHARILRSNGAITIEDLDSYNGIKVNGTKIDSKVQVGEADRVEIGDYLLEFRREGQAVDEISEEAETRPVPSTKTTKKLGPADLVATAKSQAVAPVAEVPTVPMERVPEPEPEPEPHARMVVLSTNFAGQEWTLDKPRVVIGRTEENDISINHRSISRHHAELVETEGRWSIVDLQSSNGVRVNGEDYGKVELRRGDIVDLGHVRLRFVEAGEDFVFGRDAQAVDIVDTGSGRSFATVFLVLLLLAGGVFAYLFLNDKDKAPLVASTPADASAPAAAVVADATSPVPAPPDAQPKVDQQVLDLIAKAQLALEAESWVEAEVNAKKALELQPDNTDAAAIEQKALLEKPNLVFYDEFKTRAAEEKPKYDEVVNLYGKIADESVYKDRALADYDRVKAMYIREITSIGEDLAEKGKCSELRRLATNAGKLFADAEAAARGIRCTRIARPDPPPKTPDTTTTTTKPPPGGEDGKIDIQATLEKARSAAMRNQWGAARNACEAILKEEPGNVAARSLCLLAACSLKSVKNAERHYRRLPASRKGWAIQQCFNSGVEIQE